MGFEMREGMSAEDSPYPLPELATGNLICLKDETQVVIPTTGQTARWGVIVTHTERNIFGVPMVQCVVYDDAHRVVMDDGNHVPILFEFPASAFTLWRLHNQLGADCFAPEGFDLYPGCETCKGTGNKPDNSEVCPACKGSGHSVEMRRLPAAWIPKPLDEDNDFLP